MKKALALSAFALVMALPMVSSAASLTSSFLTSGTGTEAIFVSDTIQFEVSLSVDAGVNIDTLLFTVSGDRDGALLSSPGTGWAGVALTSHWAFLPSCSSFPCFGA